MPGSDNTLVRCGQRWSSAVIALLLTLANINPSSLASTEGKQLVVATSLVTGQSVTPDTVIELRLNRPLLPREERLGVLIGNTDVSNLLTVFDMSIAYTPRVSRLPVGESEVVVYIVSPDNIWKEVARFPLRVEATSPAQPHLPSPPSPERSGGGEAKDTLTQPSRRRGGFDRSEWRPALTIGLKSQMTESHYPDTNRPLRSTFVDFTVQGSLRAEMTRGGFGSQLHFDVVGSSFQQEALRFGQEGSGAPRIDLSSYLMQFQLGRARLSVGSVNAGANRHLMNNFSSRGIAVTVPVSSRLEFAVAAMNGTNVVGWSNFFGLSRTEHQVLAGSIGFEVLKERPGGLRLETTVLDGRVLPINNFNQGVVNDAERSRGIGFRVQTSDRNQRWKLDGGYSRSRFVNPSDPLLFQGREVVPVREETRAARYLDVSYVLLRDLALNDIKKVNLTVNYRHENVAPLFRSVATLVQPDRNQNQLEVFANVGDVTATLSHHRFNDNLGNVASVLTTLSRRTNAIIGAPLNSLLGNGKQPSAWLPRISYSYDEMHQFAASLPVGGAFELNPSTLPDQVSSNQSLSADWQWRSSRFGYRFNRSFQDNRQLARERADLRNLVHVFSFGINPSPKLDVSLDVNAESALNRETNRTDRVLRLGPLLNWRPTERISFSLTLSLVAAGDAAGTSRNRNADVDAMWSYRFTIDRGRNAKVQGSFFVRYASRHATSFDTVFGFNNLTRLNTLNTGLSFTF